MRNVLLFCILATMISACTPEAEVINDKGTKSHPPTQEYLTGATLWVQHSGEYRALCLQAYALASMRLIERIQSGVKNPAVILDLDETVLNNIPYTGWQIENDLPYSSESWARWTDLAGAEEIPGSGDFLRLADRLGVTIFYISNRDTSALEPTIENMKTFHMPQLSEDHFMLTTGSSGKEGRRAVVDSLGFEVVLLIGDNLGDFHEQWDKKSNPERNAAVAAEKARFGKEYIVLPNPVYGTWEGALYQFDRSISDEQRSTIRKEALQVAPIGR